MQQHQLAALQAGHFLTPEQLPRTKPERRAMRLAKQREREENPEKFRRKRWRQGQSRPGGTRH